jgi:hypothetical protein
MIVALRRVGEALYGERWQSALAKDLGVEARSVRRWMAGEHPVPNDVWPALKRLCRERVDELKKVEKTL